MSEPADRALFLAYNDDWTEQRKINELQINLADFAVATNVLGPGRRAIIWVQGCPRRCPECITPHMQGFGVDREWITPADLARRVLECGPLEGVTFVGGEPFGHARQLAELVNALRLSSNLSVVTYSGHTLERLRAASSPDWQCLLAVTDLLIDGPYIAAQSCDLLWRGSANQRLHFLSDRYCPLEPYVQQARGRWLEFDLDRAGNVRVIGIPERGFFEHLIDRLAERGIRLHMVEAQPCA